MNKVVSRSFQRRFHSPLAVRMAAPNEDWLFANPFAFSSWQQLQMRWQRIKMLKDTFSFSISLHLMLVVLFTYLTSSEAPAKSKLVAGTVATGIFIYIFV